MISFLLWLGPPGVFLFGWLVFGCIVWHDPDQGESHVPAVEVRSLNYGLPASFYLSVVHTEPLAIHELQFRFSYPVLTPEVVSVYEPLPGKPWCPLCVCLISPVGGSSVPRVLPCLMDPRATIDFSVCSAFYLLLGWSNDLLPIITKEIEKERKESVKCCRVYKANWETIVNPTAVQLENTIPTISAKMGTIHARWARLMTETVWT